MNSDHDFSLDEIRERLEELGYYDISDEKLKDFAADLRSLVEYESSSRSRSCQSLSSPEGYSHSFATDTDAESDKTKQHQGYKSRIGPPRRYVPSGKENVVQTRQYSYDDSDLPSTCSSYYKQVTERPSSRQYCKRKVLRKMNGESRVFDESMSTDGDSVTSDISELEQRLRDLPIKGHDDLDSAADDIETGKRYIPSYIRPSMKHPHQRDIKKSDPVTRFHQFSQDWKHNRAPGEKSHKNLRWNVREKLLHHDMFERRQRAVRKNNYVVPTDKKRLALRWEVRSNLANV